MKKRGIAFETLAKWIIALLVLAIAILGIAILKSRGMDLLEKIQNLFRFGR
jgi:UPF0716 family protein affecting phage T7 exclusion